MVKVVDAKSRVQAMVQTAEKIESYCSDQLINSGDIEARVVKHKDRFPLALLVKGRELTIKKGFMLGQVAGRSRVPAQYLERMVAEDPELAVRCVTSGFKHSVDGEGTEKEMKVRIYSPPNEPEVLRGLVSGRYMPMGNAEILRVFAKLYPLDTMEIGRFELDEYGMTIQSRSIKQLSKAGDIKVGDIFPGFSLTNNEVSLGAFEIIARLFRLACLNGMVISVGGSGGAGRKIHLGSGDEGAKYITEYLTNQLTVLETQLEFGIPLIQSAISLKCNIDHLYNGLRRKENIKTDQLAAMFAGWQHERGLGDNLWGAVNGVTRMARDQKDISESHRFERLAGTMIQLKEIQVKTLEVMGRSYIEEMTAKGRGVLMSSN